MSIDIFIVFALLAVAVVLFATEIVSFDVTAILLLSTLLMTGILEPTATEGFSGFSNAATITIGAMFVLSEGLRKSGALRSVGDFFIEVGQEDFWRTLTVMMVIVGVVSAFINNTAAIVIFIPIIIRVAGDLGVSASKLLMPLSFASMFGGVCTLIGTSTNILVSSIAEDHGLEPFSMFEFSGLGLVFMAVGGVYLYTVGVNLIPPRRKEERELTAQYEMQEFLTDVVLEPASEHLGTPVDETPLTRDLDIDVLQVFRSAEEPVRRERSAPLEAGNVMRIRGSAGEIERLLEREDVALVPAHRWHDVDFEGGPDMLVEAVTAPDSPLASRSMEDVDFVERFGAVPLAIRRRGQLKQEHMGEVELEGGDTVLLNIDRERVPEVERDSSFVLTSEVDVPTYRPNKMPVAIAILAGVIASAAFNLLSISVAALAGCVLMIVSGCITTDEAYESINWKVMFLLIGVIPLGVAMEKTGAADLMSDALLGVLGDLGPTAAVSGFFFLSMMLTNIISNQATAALLAPIAIQAAESLGVSARPLLMAITYAASLSFMTPVGYQTNTLIYGPGQYKFTDFTKVGTPLNILFWLIATFLIPLIWSF
jgi:di/tricarboxylate transporter